MLNLELWLYSQDPHPVRLHVVQAPRMQAHWVPQAGAFLSAAAGVGGSSKSHCPFHGTDMPRGALSIDKGSVVCDEPLEAVLPSGTGLGATVTPVRCSWCSARTPRVTAAAVGAPSMWTSHLGLRSLCSSSRAGAAEKAGHPHPNRQPSPSSDGGRAYSPVSLSAGRTIPKDRLRHHSFLEDPKQDQAPVAFRVNSLTHPSVAFHLLPPSDFFPGLTLHQNSCPQALVLGSALGDSPAETALVPFLLLCSLYGWLLLVVQSCLTFL